jgi:hypothetical protein
LPYGRPSGLGKCIDDTYNLDLWKNRKAIQGLAKDHAIYAQACATPNNDDSDDPTLAKASKKKWNGIVEDALAAMRSGSRAELGDALHTMTERIDRGEVVDLPPVFRTDVDAYHTALTQAGLRVVPGMIECHCVCDELEQAGSFDRVLEDIDTGERFIGDLKTGSTVDYPHSYGVQLGVYSRSLLYDVTTGQRSPMPERVSQDRGVIIHLPAGEGRCSVHWIDLVKGWEAAKVAYWVKYTWQKDKSLLSPIIRIAPPVVASAPPVEHQIEHQTRAVVELRARIADLTDEQRAELKAIWPKGINLKTTITLSMVQVLHLDGIIDRVAGPREVTPPTTITVPPDEGREVEQSTIDMLRAKTAAIPPDGGAAWLTRTVHGCKLAGASISMKENPSLRRFELCRALYKLAANRLTDRLDDMVHATVGDVPGPTVTLLASMGADEATIFARHVDALVLDAKDAAAQPNPAA